MWTYEMPMNKPSQGDEAEHRCGCFQVDVPTRRDVLAAGPIIGFGLAALSRRATAQGESERPKEGDVFVPIDSSSPAIFGPPDIPLGGPPIFAWPMEPASKLVRNGSRLNKVVLVRFDPATLAGATRDHAAEGVVAYTAICPHTGCDVTGWLAEQQILECPCHSSLYNPREGGAVMAGPAPRALPALPLKIVDGKLMVARPFTSRVGFTQG
jgi:rieske iron-sulfur protein